MPVVVIYATDNSFGRIWRQVITAMNIILLKLMEYYGVTEQLKAENQLEWIRQMNACVAQAEEAIKAELIYN